MVEGDGVGGSYRLLVGRQRRFREGARPRVRRLDGRPRRALQALCDAGRGRCGEAAEHRGIAWEGGLVERVAPARADVKAGARTKSRGTETPSPLAGEGAERSEADEGDRAE